MCVGSTLLALAAGAEVAALLLRTEGVAVGLVAVGADVDTVTGVVAAVVGWAWVGAGGEAGAEQAAASTTRLGPITPRMSPRRLTARPNAWE
jgi:hypothetical protein